MAGEKKATQRPSRALYVTHAALGRSSNDDVLDAYKLLGEELVRRIRNYGENATTPAALLDGVQLASKAHKSMMKSCFGLDSWPYNLSHGQAALVAAMAELDAGEDA